MLNKDILLDEREKFIPLDTSKPYKINADTTGFCVSSISHARKLYLLMTYLPQTRPLILPSASSSLGSKQRQRTRRSHFLTGWGLSLMHWLPLRPDMPP